MNWFVDWWNGLSMLQQIFAVIAIPATIMLLLQTILLLFGIGGGHDADHGDFSDADAPDADADFHDGAHHADGLRIFTVRGFVAFFAVCGWLGIALGDTDLHSALTVIIALAGGFAALILTALILKWSLSLQDQGNLDLKNAIGKTAQVYIPIPANGEGAGKITMNLQDRYVELSAITTANAILHTDQMVKVTGLINQGTLVVKPIGTDENA